MTNEGWRTQLRIGGVLVLVAVGLLIALELFGAMGRAPLTMLAVGVAGIGAIAFLVAGAIGSFSARRQRP